MDFLGIGPLELVFIILIALIIFGPNDIVKAGRTLGSFLRKVVTSDGWRAFQQASKGMRDLPTTLMREAGLEEEDLRELTGIKDFEDATRGLENEIRPWTTPPTIQLDNPVNPESKVAEGETSQPKVEDPSTGQDTDSLPEESAAPPSGSPFSQTIDDND